VFNATPWPLYPRERDPVFIFQEAGWVPGPVWTGVEKLALSGSRSLDGPVCSDDKNVVLHFYFLYADLQRLKAVVALKVAVKYWIHSHRKWQVTWR
jgi:hypothetical protein